MHKLILVVTRGGQTQRFAVPGDRPSVVGRGEDADMRVADVSISRQQFTLRAAGDGLDIEVSPQSRNQVLLNGHPVQKCRMRPGDRLSVGYCSFEVVAEAEVPVARREAVPPDPAGFIDPLLAEEEKRIAPRWQASIADAEAEKKKKEAQQQAAAKPRTTAERMVLPGAVLVLFGLVGVIFLRDRPPPVVVAPKNLDLFANPPPTDCVDAEECFGRAKRAFELGVKLSEQSGADPATLYKAARQFQIATLALHGQSYRLPELQPRYEAARQKVITAFDDARLRLMRAQQEGNPNAALQAIDEQLAMLQDSKDPYKDILLRARVKIREVRDQARRDSVLTGGR